jgi:hypothetical protein
MTVQSIDKRVVPEANMTSVSQDKQQTGTSAEDAFLSVLQQTTQRYSGKTGKLGGLLSGDKVLSEHITRLRTEVKVDARQDTRDSAPQPAAKDAKPAAKGDKTRAAAATPAAPRKSDGDQAAPAKVKADDDTSAAQSPQAQAADDDTRSKSGDDGAPAPAEAKGQDKQEMVVAVELTITETVQVVQVDNSAPMTQDDLKSLAAAISNQLTGKQDGDDGQDPLAGLSAADRQRITDLENQLVNDAGQGDFEDALDDATQLVQQIIAKVGEHKAAAQATGVDDKSGLADDQARDLAAMLSGSNVHLDVKVQTRGADTAPAVQATTLVDAMSLTELAAGQGAASQPGSQDPQAGQGFAAGKDAAAAAEPVAVAPVQDAAQGQTVETDSHPFAAVLAAQMEASSADDAAAPQQHGVAGLASVGGTQATDKASAGQAAQSAARTPRTLLQAQVMEQVTVQIDKQVKDGADTIKIQLKPYELGKIEVKLEVSSDGRVSATVTADKPETLAMLQKDAKGLEKALEDAGLKPDTSATTFSLKGGEQQQNADRGNNNGRSRRGRSRGGEAGTDGTAAASGITQAGRNRTLGGRSGVDISV